MKEPLKVFITYSHKDPQENKDLKTHLAVMEQNGEIKIWDDNEILPGDEWYKDISNNLFTSDILLYLVSHTSLASENCNKELAEALGEKIRVIPIILEDCDWRSHKVSKLEVLPDKGKPINEWQPKNRGWQNVVNGIRKVVNAMRSEVETSYAGEDEAIAEIQIGSFLQILGQTDLAINRYSHAIEISPNNAVAYSNRGSVYSDQGNFDQAIADYDRAIELDPSFGTAYYNRGKVYGDQGNFDQAIADYDRAIKLDPNDAMAYTNRGKFYSDQGNFDQAIADYDRAIELDPDHTMAYTNRGKVYGEQGNFNQAIADCDRAIELDPDHTMAYTNRGKFLQ